MSWRVAGRVFEPAAHAWAGSHAQVPTPLVYPDKVRVFYADRYADGRSYTTFLDLDRSDLSRVVRHRKEAILPFGAPGTFDDDGETWRRMFEGPVLDRSAQEPYIAVTPSILIEDGLWRMWYISGLRWTLVEGRYEPVYVIKYASSRDGLCWDRPNHLCIPQAHEDEAFSHPTVIRDGDLYRMWYCHRGSRDYRDGSGAYRIGYAESPDGLAWTRMDDVLGLAETGQDWASTMTCYPFVTQIDDQVVMFFNGNGFGRSGFGYAVLERFE